MKQTQRISRLNAATAVFMSVLMSVFVLLSGMAAPVSAYAETDDIEAEADEAQQELERTTEEYNTATAKVEEIESQIAANEERIAELEEDLPEQQKNGALAMRAMYKIQHNSHSLLDLVLNAEDLDTFLHTVEYAEHVQARNSEKITQLTESKAELEEIKANLEASHEEATAAAEEAETALKKAQEAREEAQRKAQEKAEREAAEARAAEERAQAEREAAEAEAKAAEEAAAAEAENNSSSSSDSGSGSSSSSSSSSSENISNGASADGADWSDTKEAFVEKWAPRIDNYLAGSPLAGQGKTFAAAAWDYGVDPRWSPAISNTESSKGLYCFKSHNAWGWGSSSWSTWEEAIYAHVRGLARGYGYTISVSSAKKYCPPNWQHWYNATSAQMNKI